MARSVHWWRDVTGLVAGLLALTIGTSTVGQGTLPGYDPARVSLLAFRPIRGDVLLLATSDDHGRLQAHLVHVTDGGRTELVRTLPGQFASAAWLDDNHVVTGDDDGKLASWSIDEELEPKVLAVLAEPIMGIGVAPLSHNLALRLKGTLRLVAADGRPNGPTITLGQATPGESCPPNGLERAPAFSPDERFLVFSGLCGDLRITAQDGTRLAQANSLRPAVKRHVFSTDGRALIVAYTASSGADMLPADSGRFDAPRTLDADEATLDITALPAGRGFVVLTGDGLRFVDTDGNLRHADIPPPGSTRLAASPDGNRIAVTAAQGLVLLDGEGQRLGRPFADFGLPLATRAIAGGTQMAALYADGRLRVWLLDGSESRDPLKLWTSDTLAADADAQTPRLFVSPTGGKVGVLAPDSQFEVFDRDWNRVGRPIRFPAGPKDTTLAGTLLLDDRVLRPMPDGTGFLVLDFDGRVLGRMAFGDKQKLLPEAAAASADLIAIYTSDGRLAAWSRDGRPVRQRKVAAVSGLTSPMLDISADGKTIVLHDSPPTLPPHLLIWRPGDEDSLESREGRFAGLLADGSVLRVEANRLVLDAPDGKERLSLPLEGERLVGVTPDGKLALALRKNVVRVVAIAPDKP